VGQVNREGSTPLLLAAGEGFDDVVERLLKAGADVNHKNALGNSALHKAAGHGMHFKKKFLKNKNKTPGNSALHRAAGHGMHFSKSPQSST